MGELALAAAPAERRYEQPRARLLSDLPTERWTQARFKRDFLARIATAAEVVVQVEPEMEGTFAEAIDAGPENEVARRRVGTNAGSALYEACFKNGHVTEIERERNDSGQIEQFGLNTHDMHYNSYVGRPNRPKELKLFTLAEGLNGYREEDAARAGLLKDNYIVVASCVAEGLPEEDLDYRGDGYFTHSMTSCVQATTENSGGKIITQSAFNRGTAAAEDASFEERVAKRYDIKAIGRVYEKLGFKAPGTALGLLQNPLVIPKEMMPNGVIDFMRWCDIAADELQGLGSIRPIERYIQMREESRTREAGVEEVKQKIIRDLYAAAGTFQKKSDANDLLMELVHMHGSREANKNSDIDHYAFGEEVAAVILGGRAAYLRGDWFAYEMAVRRTYESGHVSMCGGGKGKKKSQGASQESDDTAKLDQDENESAETEESSEEVMGDKEVVCCPECRKNSRVKDVETVVDGKQVWRCPPAKGGCGYTVDICDGATIDYEGPDGETEPQYGIVPLLREVFVLELVDKA